MQLAAANQAIYDEAQASIATLRESEAVAAAVAAADRPQRSPRPSFTGGVQSAPPPMLPVAPPSRSSPVTVPSQLPHLLPPATKAAASVTSAASLPFDKALLDFIVSMLSGKAAIRHVAGKMYGTNATPVTLSFATASNSLAGEVSLSWVTSNASKERGSIPFGQVLNIERGIKSPVMKHAEPKKSAMYVSLLTRDAKHSSIDLELSSAADADAFFKETLALLQNPSSLPRAVAYILEKDLWRPSK